MGGPYGMGPGCCAATTPDDGTGCCSYLPAADVAGSIAVTSYDGYGTPIGSATLGPTFTYYPGPLTLTQVAPFGQFQDWRFEDGYHVAGPDCLADRFLYGDPATLAVTLDLLFNRRAYAVLGCCTPIRPEGSTADPTLDTARVRLFIVSNRGQENDTADGVPATCDDSTGFGLDPWDWDVPGGSLLCYFLAGLSTLAGNGDAVPPGVLAQCGPLCYAVDGTIPWGQGRAAVSGSIGADPCSLPDYDDGCPTTITVIQWCPDSCPATGAPIWSLYATDPGGRDFGPAPLSWGRDGDGNCLYSAATVAVRVPYDPGTGAPVHTRDFDLRVVFGDATPDLALGTVTVTDCEPVLDETGIPPVLFRASFCLTGCPDGAPLPSNPVDVVVRSSDGATVYERRTVTTGPDGCGVAILQLPAAAGSYRVDLEPIATYEGYATGLAKSTTATLPAAGSTCFAIDLGTAVAPTATDHVCTCLGNAPKCWAWNGNGSPVELTYNATSGAWEGYETVSTGTPGWDGSECFVEAGTPDIDAYILVSATIPASGADPCAPTATRTTPGCTLYGELTGPCSGGPAFVLSGGGTPAAPAGNPRETDSTVTVAAWGPTGDFPTFNFADWTKPDGTDDPDHCHAPAEGYDYASVGGCTGAGGGGMTATVLRSAPAEPPLPSAGRMAAGLVATGARAVAGAMVGRPVAATPEEQALRWSTCRACTDHFRPSDERCGAATGCGCWLAKAIPLAAKRCPVGKW